MKENDRRFRSGKRLNKRTEKPLKHPGLPNSILAKEPVVFAPKKMACNTNGDMPTNS